MNNIITRYKKTVLLATVVVAMGFSSAVFAVCGPCAANAAIKQSIKDAQAALIAAGKPASRAVELDDVPTARAAREALEDPCNLCFSCPDENGACDLNDKLQALFNCCVNTNQQVRHQGHEAEKCCKKLRHEIDEVEDQVEDGFSVVESLILSQTDAAAACCSVTESLILTQIDAAAACCSVTNALIVSQIDQTAVCCSTTDAVLAQILVLVTSIFNCTCT